MTRIVNIKFEEFDLYIGRPGKGQSGYYGNPHNIGYCKICKKEHDREECLKEYKKYFYNRINNDPKFKEKILELKDKTLGCFCKTPLDPTIKCHGDIIKEYLDGQTVDWI